MGPKVQGNGLALKRRKNSLSCEVRVKRSVRVKIKCVGRGAVRQKDRGRPRRPLRRGKAGPNVTSFLCFQE